MKVSIITATFNSGNTIRDTLESVRKQNYPEVEHIIVDGCSKDETVALIKRYPHVAQIICEPDKGIYDAMNKGVRMATGEVIGILNSDDVYARDTVLSSVMKIFEDERVDACYADLQYVRAANLNKVTRIWKSGKFSRQSFYWGWMPPHPTFFVRRRVYDAVGEFNLSLKSAADYELMLRICLKHDFQIVYLPQVIVKMRAGGVSNASLKNRLRANGEDRQAWKINGLKPFFFTLYLKPLRKIFQFITK